MLANLTPLYLIDIPNDTEEFIIDKILEVSDLVLVQSWLTHEQTTLKLQSLSARYRKPTLCLLRDC
jgi:hypothetical protein